MITELAVLGPLAVTAAATELRLRRTRRPPAHAHTRLYASPVGAASMREIGEDWDSTVLRSRPWPSLRDGRDEPGPQVTDTSTVEEPVLAFT